MQLQHIAEKTANYSRKPTKQTLQQIYKKNNNNNNHDNNKNQRTNAPSKL